MDVSKEFLKPLQSETESSMILLSSSVNTDVNTDVNLGSLSDMTDTLTANNDDNSDQQLKVDGVLSTSSTNLLPDSLVLVETSKGLVFSNLTNIDGINFSSSFVTSGTDNRGQTVMTASLPTTIPVFSQLMNSSDESSVAMYSNSVLIPGNIFQDGDTNGQLQTVTNITITDNHVETDIDDQTKKRKGLGGWPKGKKRKPTPCIEVPKKPMTGYVIFASQRRQEIKASNPELTFPEVTRQMGQEWSRMLDADKQKYLKAANEDKLRYISEMQEFQKSVQFQTYLKNKRKSDELNGCLTDETNSVIDLKGNEGIDELYCKVCKQYFISQHNKKEHMYGQQHLRNITAEMVQTEQMMLASVQEDVNLSPNIKHSESSTSSSEKLDINDFMQEFIKKNCDREEEISILRKFHKSVLDENLMMSKRVKELEEYENKLDQDVGSLKAYGASLSAQVDALKMVPTLFGVINFCHDCKTEC
ncbi:hypothetical protein ACF0H5_008749 [Mactra antiquata]